MHSKSRIGSHLHRSRNCRAAVGKTLPSETSNLARRGEDVSPRPWHCVAASWVAFCCAADFPEATKAAAFASKKRVTIRSWYGNIIDNLLLGGILLLGSKLSSEKLANLYDNDERRFVLVEAPRMPTEFMGPAYRWRPGDIRRGRQDQRLPVGYGDLSSKPKSIGIQWAS